MDAGFIADWDLRVRSVLPSGPGEALASLDDAALMQRYCGGEIDAFATLYRRHRAGLHRFIARLCTRSADADEIFQEVWMAVINGRAHYAPSARFVTYLFAIAHRRIADRARTIARRREDAPAELIACLPAADDPLVATEHAQRSAALLRAVAALPDEQRSAFLMRAEGGLSVAEIAETTGTPPETAKSRLRAANRALRMALEEWR